MSEVPAVAFSESRPTLSTYQGRWAGLGPYYAMFPLDFALSVINTFSEPGDGVLDPFCGRGTAVYAGSCLARRSLGIEINPVGWIYGKAKLRAAPKEKILERLVAIDKARVRFREDASVLPVFFKRAFSFKVRCFLLAARLLLDWRGNNVDRTLMSFILVYLHGKREASMSNQMRQTKAMSPEYSVRWWASRGMRPPVIDPVAFLRQRIEWRYKHGRPWRNFSEILLGDAAEVLNRVEIRKSPPFDLLLTSPPYFGLTNYHYDQWLRLWMLGHSASPTREQHRYKKRFECRAAYRELLENVFEECAALTRSNSVVYVRTDAREFTLSTTIDALKAAFPRKRLRSYERPIERKSQTSLFGDIGQKPGEIDLVMT